MFTLTKKKINTCTSNRPNLVSGFKKNFYQYQTEQTISLTSSLYSKQFSIWKCYLIFSLSHFFLSLSLSNIYTLLKISPISDSLDPHHYIWTQWTITTPIPHPQTLYTLSNSLHSTPLTCSQNSTPCLTPSPAHYPSTPPSTLYPTSDPALSRARIARADSGVSTMRKLSSTLFLQYL